MKSKLEGEGPAQVRDSELDLKISGESLQHFKQEGVVFRVHCRELILCPDPLCGHPCSRQPSRERQMVIKEREGGQT